MIWEELQQRAQKGIQGGEWTETFQAYQELLRAEKNLSRKDRAELYLHCARELRQGKKFSEALSCLQEGLQGCSSEKSQEHKLAFLHEEACLAYDQGAYRQAVEKLRKELSLWNSSMEGYVGALADIFREQGRNFLALNDLTEAELYLNHAYSFSKTAKDLYRQASAREQQAELAARQGRKTLIVQRLEEAEDLYQKNGNNQEAQRCRDWLQLISRERTL